MTTSKITPRPLSVSFKRPKLFGPAFTRRVIEGEGEVKSAKGRSLSDTNVANTASFRYDPPGLGIRSTQQIPLDWSNFANHTFFNSAEANVNVAFDKIINEYPFDGTQKEIEEFLDDLTGFEKWVFDSFPKNLGYLLFFGSAYIAVKDFAGAEHPTLSKNQTGEKILDPGVKSLTIESHIALQTGSNANQVIYQNISKQATGDYGYTVAVESTGSSTQTDLRFIATSGSLALSASVTVQKGEFHHLAFTLNRKPGVNRLQIYQDGTLVVSSTNAAEMGEFGFTNEVFSIGSGSSHDFGGSTFTPAASFKGAVDELRVFHAVRTPDQLRRLATKNINASDDLKLYFKFNEPAGSLGQLSNLVLDSSGNSLHSRITNFAQSLRNTGSVFTPAVTNERRSLNPVLFPAYSEVVALNTKLLTSASTYDESNPNLITRMVPKHYFLEGQQAEGFQDEDGDIGDPYGGTGIPGSGELGAAQLLSSLLFVWAKYFDEMKIYIDQLSNVLHVDYDADGTVADQFLPLVFKYHGFDVPSFFSNSTIEQFVGGENLGLDFALSEQSLQFVQNQMWRRILTNLGDVVRSKGTLHSIKSLIRAAGINPDSTLRIREFGGPTERSLGDARFDKTEVSALLDFSGSLADVSSSLNPKGVANNKPFLESHFLTSSRIEAGQPLINGTFVKKDEFPIHGISDQRRDGLLTSGSWSYEAYYKFPLLQTGSHPTTQSLVRLNTTGTLGGIPRFVHANVLAISGSGDAAKLKLFSRPGSNVAAELLELSLTGANLFDGNVWSVAFGRTRGDFVNQGVSSSYFLRAGRQHMGELVEQYVTTSFFKSSAPTNDILQNGDTDVNRSGSFITVGSQSIATSGNGRTMLSHTGITGSEVRYTNFTGKIGQFRFWSKDLSVTEWQEHVRNFKSIGVQDPLVNFNFDTQISGAFERLRIDASIDQPVTDSDSSGNIEIFDFTQNGFHISGSGFEPSTSVIKPETFRFSFVSPKFDEAGTNNKIRVRSFLSQEKADQFKTDIAPVYEITPSESPKDDTRFTIDFSVVDALDEDIIKLFSTLDLLENSLGNPELRHAEDYPDLEKLRDIYFNRLTEKMNLKGFFEFFKWFDGSIGMFIEQLLPRKTNYLGTNFVIESHMLERPKVRYIEEDRYLEENLRRPSTITVVSDEEGQAAD